MGDLIMIKYMLKKNIFANDIEMRATRDGFGDALVQLGKENLEVVALCADLTESVQMHKFRDVYPDRFFQMGVAEQNMASVASGMSAMGCVPFIASYAMFNPGRNWEQIRTTICYNDRKVIIVGAHAGLSVGPDGGTHQALEDIAIMRAIPNITIFSPADYVEAYKLTLLAYQIEGPVYLRLAREKSKVLFEDNYEPKNGQGEIVYLSKNMSSNKVGIIATGPILYEALKAAKELEDNHHVSVSVMNIHGIKNMDRAQLVRFAINNKKIVTVEEHQVAGGLGSAVAEILGEDCPTKMRILGVKNRFGQSGTVNELYKEYEIDAESIVSKTLELLHSN
jgi:transketolase